MAVLHKAAVSLLISVLLSAVFTVLAFAGLFDLVETRFYDPSIIKALTRELEKDAAVIEEFLAELEAGFSATLKEPAVRRSFLPNQEAEDIFERSRVYGLLLESQAGLQSVRFVDAEGSRIHFSNAPQDILDQDQFSLTYRNYGDVPGDLPYSQVEVPYQGMTRLTLDGELNRIIFSFPLYDSFGVYRGTGLFTLSLRAVTGRLIAERRIKVGEDVSIISKPPGILSGIPGAGQALLQGQVLLPMAAAIWSEGILSLTPLDSAADTGTLALISAKTSQGIFVGRLVNESLFSFPPAMKYILLGSFFITLYLVIFLFFNLPQDTMMVIRNRLKRLRVFMIDQFYTRKGEVDWTYWIGEMERRREDIRTEMKRGLRIPRSKQASDTIDTLIDKSWDELLAIIGSRQNTVAAAIDEKKVQTILNRILQNMPSGAPAPTEEDDGEYLEELEAFEESPAAGDAEVVAELKELAGDRGISVLYRPFLVQDRGDPEILEPLPEDAAADGEIILERGGLHFINNNILTPDIGMEKTLDPAFKYLVDSVLTKNH
ncbi:MAG: cache domain-containing protein [Treponema sp.]|nr:cache domain-containing protein [Treponema sp.]